MTVQAASSKSDFLELETEGGGFTKSFLRFARHRAALVGAVVLGIFVFVGLFADTFMPYDPLKMDIFSSRQSPSAMHWLGTDELGRDILSRIVLGARLTLSISGLGVVVGLIFGAGIGVIAGFFGGRVDNILMRGIDLLLAFPGVMMAVVIITIVGPGIQGVIVAVVFSTIPAFARISRGSTLITRELEFIEAARAIGAGDGRIIRRHIFPNILAPILVQVSLGLARAILLAAGLSFLGLGAQPPTPEWGAMLSNGRTFLVAAPHIVMFPGLAIMIIVMSLNLVGDGLRDHFDPRLRGVVE